MLKDGFRIKQSTETTGSGVLSLNPPSTNYNSFVSEVGTGNTCFYTLIDANGIDWEVGIGTITAGVGNPDTLSRTTVLRSSNNNAPLSLSAGVHSIVNAPVAGYATGDINFQFSNLIKPLIKNYAETIATPAISGGVLTLDLTTGNVFNVSHNANITSVVITNASITGRCYSLTLDLTQDATGSRTLALPASWKFTANPTVSTTANKCNRFVLDTKNAGSTWFASYCGAF